MIRPLYLAKPARGEKNIVSVAIFRDRYGRFQSKTGASRAGAGLCTVQVPYQLGIGRLVEFSHFIRKLTERTTSRTSNSNSSRAATVSRTSVQLIPVISWKLIH